jgi:hypothetical protein
MKTEDMKKTNREEETARFDVHFSKESERKKLPQTHHELFYSRHSFQNRHEIQIENNATFGKHVKSRRRSSTILSTPFTIGTFTIEVTHKKGFRMNLLCGSLFLQS